MNRYFKLVLNQCRFLYSLNLAGLSPENKPMTIHFYHRRLCVLRGHTLRRQRAYAVRDPSRDAVVWFLYFFGRCYRRGGLFRALLPPGFS